MSLPATDDFNRGPAELGSNWTKISGDPEINVSNQLAYGSSGDTYGVAYWNADSFNNDQYSQLKLISSGQGPASVRISGTSPSDYNGYTYFSIVGLAGTIRKWVAGSETTLQSGITAPSANDIVKITAEGTTLRAYNAGVQVGTDQTDSSIASGSAGIWVYPGGFLADDWEGGNVGAAAVETLGYLRANRLRPRIFAPGLAR